MHIDYLKIGSSGDLKDGDFKIYRALEILPGFLSWSTLLVLIVLSYFKPVLVAYIVIAFDVYWLLLVLFLGIHLISAYTKYQKNLKIDWMLRLKNLKNDKSVSHKDSLSYKDDLEWQDIIHMIVLPTSYEGLDIIEPTIKGIVNDGFPTEQMIVVFAVEGRAGEEARVWANNMKEKYGKYFRNFVIVVHPDGIEGEIKGKGSNQAWAAKEVKKSLVDKENLDYDKILVSVFDIDTIVEPGYFSCLSYKFLTVRDPYRASYQPVPLYHNNIWKTSFFARVAASSNTFWQMMQQIRHEKLATYSSHSMTWRALSDVDFWSVNMVSEDSRIFWHCFCFYDGDYRVEPLHFPVSMDATEDKNALATAKNLYKQQRRWGWGVENLPYLIFNIIKRRKTINIKNAIGKTMIQLYGFHSWATNALIIGVIGWLPMFLGGDRFNQSVLSTNLPFITRTLMTAAMSGMVLSAIISTLLLPKRKEALSFIKKIPLVLQWVILPISIVVFGAIPGLEAQTRLMLNKRLGFQVTPKGAQASAATDGKEINWDQT